MTALSPARSVAPRKRMVAWWLAIALEVAIARYFLLQPVLGVAGAPVVVLAWCAHRRQPRS